jgi:hypothetical protein
MSNYEAGDNRRTKRPINPNSMMGVNKKYDAFREGWEVITQPLYDYQTYAQAGQTLLSFFQTQAGSSGKTFADTNMQMAGQLPANQRFLVGSIAVDFIPAGVASQTGAVVEANFNDMTKIANSGYLQFNLGTKQYYTGAPLKFFPTNTGVGGVGSLSDTTTAAAARVTTLDAPIMVGNVCRIKPIMIPSNETFSVSLNWPAAVSISVAGRIGVRLGGNLYRRSQ